MSTSVNIHVRAGFTPRITHRQNGSAVWSTITDGESGSVTIFFSSVAEREQFWSSAPDSLAAASNERAKA